MNFTKALSKLVIQQGIRVNAVAPGPVWTPLIPATMTAEKIENFGDNTLFERPAQPAELAPLYVWLASPQASYLTAKSSAAQADDRLSRSATISCLVCQAPFASFYLVPRLLPGNALHCRLRLLNVER